MTVDRTSRARRGRKRSRAKAKPLSKQLNRYQDGLTVERQNHSKGLANRSFYALLDLLSDGIMDELRLVGTHHYVNCIIVVDDKIVSGGADSMIKVWNGTTFQCETTVPAHSAAVIYLLRVKDKMLSCSADKSIKVWNMGNWQCERTLTGHSHCVYTLMHQGNSIITASIDRTIKVWSTKSWECTETTTFPLAHHTDRTQEYSPDTKA